MLTTDHPVALKAALRHDTIRRAIEINGRVSIADLRDRLGVSEVTIREDLKHLESRGVLTRVRGGAVVSRNGVMEMSLEETSTTNHAEKMAIAAHAARHGRERPDHDHRCRQHDHRDGKGPVAGALSSGGDH